jgi:SAM-dependent methyltransferase
VYYVQGSVLEPPLKDRVVDYIYCAGVLIHLPEPRVAFECLPRSLKLGGRYVVWLYHPLDRHRKTGDYVNEVVYEWLRRHVTSRLPIRLQELFYLSLLAPFFVKRMLLNPFRRVKEDRTYREKMQNFIDTMSPVHANRHTEEETIGRFRTAGYDDVVVAYNDLYGFGVRGTMVRSDA